MPAGSGGPIALNAPGVHPRKLALTRPLAALNYGYTEISHWHCISLHLPNNSLILLKVQVLKKILNIGCIALISGCATPPAIYEVAATRTSTKSYDLVWEKIVEYMSSRNIQIKNIAKDSGIIYAEVTKFDEWAADCGNPGILSVAGRLATFNVFVNRSSGNNVISVNTSFVELRQFGGGTILTVPCNSTGRLEAAILDSVK